MVPTSALSSDGMGSLISQVIQICQTTLVQRLTHTDELQATVMEVCRAEFASIFISFYSIRSNQVTALVQLLMLL